MKRTADLVVWSLLLLFMGPVLWTLFASFKSEATLFSGTADFSLSLEHYRAVLNREAFWRGLLNSLLVSSLSTVICVSVAIPGAYALARLEFGGRRLVALGLLLLAMFPPIAIVSPLYLLLRKLSLLGSAPGLVLPYTTFALPLAVWLLQSHLQQLPKEIEDAAELDGADRLNLLTRIVIPLALPGILSTAIVTFVFCWNEFLFALSFTIGSSQHTAPVALALLRGQHQIPWGQLLAGTVLTTLPVAILVLVFQKRIVQSLGGP